MKYKIGDRVRIKSLDWYNKNKNKQGDIWFNNIIFISGQSFYCGCELMIQSIKHNSYYVVENNDYYWTDEMIEGLVEEEVGLVDQLSSRWINEFNLPNGYIFKDENGDVINATKIVLEKKKREYPKTYGVCKRIMGVEPWNSLWGEDATEYEEQTEDLIDAFIRLKICRDAYWKIAGEEMELGKPWKPDWTDSRQKKWTINFYQNEITLTNAPSMQFVLAFPTEEMRDAFNENFKGLIEECKELL